MEKLLWMDLEMTGLDVEKERIIEVAALITDTHLKTLDQYESVVHQPETFLKSMDEWNTQQHTKSGLWAQVAQAPPQSQVEKEICQWVQKHFREPAILCGNSIAQDRKFIHRYMKDLEALLHYRMVDVTAWKVIMEIQFSVSYKKKESHRAMDDIKESIEELKHFLEFIQKGGPPSR